MGCITAFLSHATADKAIVCDVAEELGRLGIVPWMDTNQLTASESLTTSLTEAIQSTFGFVIFLSDASVQSDWVTKLELKKAIEGEASDRIIPVCLGDAQKLINEVDALRPWINEHGKIDRLCIANKAKPVDIAQEIAKALLKQANISNHEELRIFVDQRGVGSKKGAPPELPDAWTNAPEPILVFRPNSKDRKPQDIATQKDWKASVKGMKWFLSQDIGIKPSKKVSLRADSQFAFAAQWGIWLNRTHHLNLSCIHRLNNQKLTNNTSLGSDKKTAHQRLEGFSEKPTTNQPPALLLMTPGFNGYDKDAQEYLRNTKLTTCAVLVPVPEKIETFEQVREIANGLLDYQKDVGAKSIIMFSSLPTHALSLLVSLVTPHPIKQIRFMEYIGSEDISTLYREFVLDND